MNKQDMMKIQTCVLRVNLHCDGCAHKVKKKLQKVEGVYKVNIDVEQGKVTVAGNVDPLILINKLEKAGKHAEFWGQQKGQFPILNNQFKNFQIDNIKDMKNQKGGKDQQKNVMFQVPQQMHQQKGLKDDVKFLGKDKKSVKFNLPEDEDEFDEDEDDFDEFDDEFDEEFDDEFDEEFGAHQPPSKGAPHGHGVQANKSNANGHVKAKNGGDKGGKAKKSSGFDKLLKGMLGKAGGKNGNGGKKSKKGDNKKEDGGKNSKKNGGFEFGDGKKGAINGKGAGQNGQGGGKAKGGDNFDGGQNFEGKHQMFNEMMKANHKGGAAGGGGGGGGGGRNMDFMGQMGSFPAVQGLPAAGAMNVGHFQGQGNPYNNPQYMAQMMMMNQQRQNGQEGYHPGMAYMRPNPPMPYGPPMAYGPPMGYGPPPPPNDQYSHMFNDENTDSCSIM